MLSVCFNFLKINWGSIFPLLVVLVHFIHKRKHESLIQSVYNYSRSCKTQTDPWTDLSTNWRSNRKSFGRFASQPFRRLVECHALKVCKESNVQRMTFAFGAPNRQRLHFKVSLQCLRYLPISLCHTNMSVRLVVS